MSEVYPSGHRFEIEIDVLSQSVESRSSSVVDHLISSNPGPGLDAIRYFLISSLLRAATGIGHVMIGSTAYRVLYLGVMSD
jgi:hypothetical protein